MMKIFIIITILVFVTVVLITFTKTTPSTSPLPLSTTSEQAQYSPTERFEYKAGFAVFTNGTFRIFTDSRYHNKSQEVYIESSNPNIIHVKKKGVTYNEFFKTLPMSLTNECLITGTKQTFCSGSNGRLRFFLNGKEMSNALNKPIQNGDKLLVTFGNDKSESITLQMQKIPNP